MEKRTKIVCTIGPASWDNVVLSRMITNGMNIARINGAFADVAEMRRVGKQIRELSNDVALMLDIKGHEVRLNKFSETLQVTKGDQVVIGSSPKDPLYPVTYPDVYKEIAKDQVIFVDKGEVILQVEQIKDGKIFCKVLGGNEIKGGKGMNFPGAKLKNPAITDRDIEQIKYAISHEWEFVAASFIRNRQDVLTVKKYLKGSQTKVISKIEDQQGVDNFDEILAESYGIMIARGDMGSEIPIERLPFIQKEMIFRCNQAAKPAITATNILESMTEKIFPTRAEITDVANAVLDGTDSLMTSAETTSGKYPVETVATMSKIAQENEKYLVPQIIDAVTPDQKIVPLAISNAAFEVAQSLNLDKIIVVTQTGNTARFVARLNLPIPIYVFTRSEIVKRQLNLTKGLKTFVFPKIVHDRDKAVNTILGMALEKKLLSIKDKILLIGRSEKPSKSTKPSFPNIFEYVDIADYVEQLRRT